MYLACTSTWFAQSLHMKVLFEFIVQHLSVCNYLYSYLFVEANSKRRGAVSPQGKLGFVDLAVVSFLFNYHTWYTILRPQVIGSCT